VNFSMQSNRSPTKSDSFRNHHAPGSMSERFERIVKEPPLSLGARAKPRGGWSEPLYGQARRRHGNLGGVSEWDRSV
jgi:hypothetical protein